MVKRWQPATEVEKGNVNYQFKIFSGGRITGKPFTILRLTFSDVRKRGQWKGGDLNQRKEIQLTRILEELENRFKSLVGGKKVWGDKATK